MLHFVALCVLVLSCAVTGQHQCTSTRSSALKFSITSRRNVTGHWTAQVQLEHGAQRREDGPWEVEIDHTTEKCGKDEKILIVATVTTPPKRPGADYRLIPGLGFYKFHTAGKTWAEARDACFQEGSHLAIANSEAEESAFRALWREQPKEKLSAYRSYVFLGFHDQIKEGSWVTIFGEPLAATGYPKWNKNEPSNTTSENCGCLHGDWGFNDIRCSEVLPFICEQEL